MKIALFVLLFSLLPLAWGADKEPAVPFTLNVVPSRSSPDDTGITFTDKKADEFYVVLSNVSKDAQRVFEYWNMWGHRNITFEFTMPDGKKIVVSPRAAVFTRNFPSTFLIPPGENQVYPIRLDERWETDPMLSRAFERQITLKAIYQVPGSAMATQFGVWVGRVESKLYNFTLKDLRNPK